MLWGSPKLRGSGLPSQIFGFGQMATGMVPFYAFNWKPQIQRKISRTAPSWFVFTLSPCPPPFQGLGRIITRKNYPIPFRCHPYQWKFRKTGKGDVDQKKILRSGIHRPRSSQQGAIPSSKVGPGQFLELSPTFQLKPFWTKHWVSFWKPNSTNPTRRRNAWKNEEVCLW